jgi:DNA-binding CsgD family transcriptional regulator
VTEVVMLDQTPRLFSEWEEVAAKDSYCDLALQRLESTVLFDDVPGFRDTEAWNEHWRHFDAQNMVATIMAEPLDGYVSFIGLCNADRARAFDERDRQTKELLMPHLSSALRLNRESQVIAAAESDEGVALVNRSGWVLASRAPFSTQARDEWGAAGPRIPAEILPDRAEPARWRGRAIQVQVQPLEQLFLVRARSRCPLSRMTPREQQVAEAFASGQSYKLVAQKLGIAPSTVRNHLASIYDKLGINTKSDLVRLLWS